MLCETIRRLIEKKKTDGLAEKLDIFLLHNRITKAEYEELSALLSGGAK